MDKLIFVTTIKKNLLSALGIGDEEIKIYRSKGLLAHLPRRRNTLILSLILSKIPTTQGVLAVRLSL